MEEENYFQPGYDYAKYVVAEGCRGHLETLLKLSRKV